MDNAYSKYRCNKQDLAHRCFLFTNSSCFLLLSEGLIPSAELPQVPATMHLTNPAVVGLDSVAAFTGNKRFTEVTQTVRFALDP